MTLEHLEPIPDDATLRAALEDADLAPLLAALAEHTGDTSLLRDDLRPHAVHMMAAQGALTPEQQTAARDLAFATLVRLRDDAPPPAPTPEPAALRAMMEFAVGDPVAADYLPLLREELEVGEDLRAPQWRKADVDPDRSFLVAVIGAGMSGLSAAYRLAQAGIDHVVVEKNDDVGGTWYENTYPGCRVDVPNHLYSYSFAQKDDWAQRFSPQSVLLDYFRDCADELGIRGRIRFRAEVRAAAFDEDRGVWRLTLHTADGVDEILEANAVVSAVGQLNRPRFPAIDGLESFTGPAFHSAQWDHDVDLRGKRVGVIGTGASAIQLVPIVANEAAELVLFQRTPNWFFPTPDYHDDLPEGMRRLVRCVPGYGPWYRFTLFWRTAEGVLPAARVDPDWEGDPASVSAANDFLRAILTEFLEREFGDDPELLAKVLPSYPPLAKRVLLDSGSYAAALKRDDVHLVTEPIARITPTGVVTADGTHYEVDVIVYGTGFQASSFLTPMRVTGRGGVDLHDQWAGSAVAYLGLTIAGFPNFFCLYGPNTNIVANGSIIFFSECGVRYLVECLHLLLERHARWIDLRRDRYDAYADEVDVANRNMVWGAANVNTWYKNATGRVTQNWPFTLIEYWRRTQAPDPADYELG